MIGGGPSGAVVARLLATWGYDVVLFARPIDSERSLVNSLPPSTQKILEQVGILDIVERVGYRTTGNTVWWGAQAERVEPFAGARPWGFQVDRARLDPELLTAAAAAGVRVIQARVAGVHRARPHSVDETPHVRTRDHDMRVRYGTESSTATCAARLVLDCSGRAGVLAVGQRLRRHVPGGRMQALLGVWRNPAGWHLPNPTHTFIETCEEGWAWSIPTSDTVRHVGIMVDGVRARTRAERSLVESYRRLLALMPRLERQAGAATLERVFACDASVYTASEHAGKGFLLVGDAGCTLNPLSSFGMKKALASAWLAAVTANTILCHPERAVHAAQFFSMWTSRVWRVNLERSREFAREALGRHSAPFWSAHASAALADDDAPLDERQLMNSAVVRRAFDDLRQTNTIVFSLDEQRTVVSAPVVRGRLLVMEAAVALDVPARDVIRYLRGVDLVALARLAPECVGVPAVVERYQQLHGATPLPELLAALSVLTGHGVLRARAQ